MAAVSAVAAVAIAVVLLVGAAAMMSCVPAVMMNKSLDPGVLYVKYVDI